MQVAGQAAVVRAGKTVMVPISEGNKEEPQALVTMLKDAKWETWNGHDVRAPHRRRFCRTDPHRPPGPTLCRFSTSRNLVVLITRLSARCHGNSIISKVPRGVADPPHWV